MKYFLAVDIGASSGRHIVGTVENGRLLTQEIYRFENGMKKENGTLCWDVERLFREILNGMKACREKGIIPESMGIDTWGVDFVLLDKDGERIGEAVAYRDGRTKEMDLEVAQYISEEELYELTGIQKQPFNTIYQLMALKTQEPWKLEKAEKLLMMPDYFHYLLTGKSVTEYTNASTTQLVTTDTKDWNRELIKKLGYPEKIFQPMVIPGTTLGHLRKEIQQEVGFDCEVILPATHDTGSAVLAVPSDGQDMVYISSGTWSLMGTELDAANCSPESRAGNLTNEGGYTYRFRYLKNIMGLWMIQSVKKEIADDLSFSEICKRAEKSEITSVVDCNADRFLAPENMTEEIKAACRESGQKIPEGIGETAAVIYNSLAECYADTLLELEKLTEKKYKKIYVIGGGSNAEYLNRLTAEAAGIPVCAGVSEATAVGNIAAQMITAGVLKNLNDARACIRRSFPMLEYKQISEY